jgi:hypothetical protein
MKNKVFKFFVLAFLLFTIVSCAGTPIIPMANGKAWLSSESAPPAVNVDGIWLPKNWGGITDWGGMRLRQAQDSRDVSGSTVDGLKIDGVVSGKKVFLLFFDKDEIFYSAVLTAVSDKELTGVWARGLITEQSKTEPMMLQR